MAQNEHKKVLQELSEAYRNVINENTEATSASFGDNKGHDGPWKNPRRKRPDSGDAAMEFDRRGFAKNTKAGKEDEEDSITIGDIIDQVELDLPLTPDLADALQNVMDTVRSTPGHPWPGGGHAPTPEPGTGI